MKLRILSSDSKGVVRTIAHQKYLVIGNEMVGNAHPTTGSPSFFIYLVSIPVIIDD